MALLISAIIPVWWYLALTPDSATWKIGIYYTLEGLIALAWLIWTFERCSVRRFIKRMADPTFSSEGCCTLDDGVADCCSVCCCPVQAAMQEAQFVDNLEAGANPILLGLHGAHRPEGREGREGAHGVHRVEEYKSS